MSGGWRGASRMLSMNILSPVQASRRVLYGFAEETAASDTDSRAQHLRKSIAVLSAIVVAPAAFMWGVIYLAAGEPAVSIIPFAYLPLTLVNLATYRVWHRYHAFEFSQLLITLLLPFFLMLALGGFVSSSGVITWSLVTPMGAIVYSSRRMAVFWFVLFVAAVTFAASVDSSLSDTSSVTAWAKTVMFVGNILGPSAVAFGLLAHFVKENETAYGLLDFERERSESLLKNVLPAVIAARLKDGPEMVADRFDNVSVLFGDMVGSTQLASTLSPEEMVALLNEIFSEFDEITVRNGVEKISTSGDNYLVASGVPEPRPDHAQALVSVALEMRDYLADRSGQLGVGLQMRFGINTGPAVAGVVGQRNFHYDIWGDAVNTASRMESHGEPGRVQISEATFELVKDHFECESRGEIDIKGKGLMRTWYVERRA